MLVERGGRSNLTDTAGMASWYAAVDMNMPARSTGGPNRKFEAPSRRSSCDEAARARGEPNAQAAFRRRCSARTARRRLLGGVDAADACREDRL